MKFNLEFDMDNAAFDDDWRAESARILLVVVEKLLCGFQSGPLEDINGNRLAAWSMGERQ